MNQLFQSLINAFRDRVASRRLSEADYHLLPYVHRVKARNDLDLADDNDDIDIVLPARAIAKNLLLAERMRRYATHRATK